MKSRIGISIIVILGFIVFITISQAQSVPYLINYQGRITDSAGQPLADGSTVDLTFTFYGVVSGGTAYISVLQENVVVNKGIYNVLIGSGIVTPGTENTLAEVFQNNCEVWMGVKVDDDPQMTPRSRISSVPYSFKVDTRWWTGFFNKSDYDGDGYPKVIDGATATTDCDDGDYLINPGATEICNDGIDNDCDNYIDINDPDCGLPGDTVHFDPGCFMMGDTIGDGTDDDEPYHEVCFTSSFSVDEHEVTNLEYKVCEISEGCTHPKIYYSNTRQEYYNNPAYYYFPVVGVTWQQAKDYCTWAGKRLPTEAEWEYAARGGLVGETFPWEGDTATPCVDANYDNCIGDTSHVGSYPANGYGIYDVAGNMYEWVNDWYDFYYYESSPTNDPPGPEAGTYRVIRGGSYGNPELRVRVFDRSSYDPTDFSVMLGFRCAGD